MKVLKIILITLAVIVGLLVVVSFFLPDVAHVERSIVVEAPPEVVFEQVNNLKNWEKWSPWNKLDPGMKIVYGAKTVGKGATYSWKGNDKVGEGTLTINESTINKSISTQLDFGEYGGGQGGWRFEDTADGVKITWSMDTRTDYMPVIGKYFGLMMEDMVGPTFEKGLADLKAIAEGQ